MEWFQQLGGRQKTILLILAALIVGSLPCYALGVLALSQTAVDDAAISPLCKMQTLNWLLLNDTLVSGQGLLQFRDALADCQLDGDLVDLTT